MQEKFFQEGRKNCQTNGGKRTRGILVIFSQIFLFVFKFHSRGRHFQNHRGWKCLYNFLVVLGTTSDISRIFQQTRQAFISGKEGKKMEEERAESVLIPPVRDAPTPSSPFML